MSFLRTVCCLALLLSGLSLAAPPAAADAGVDGSVDGGDSDVDTDADSDSDDDGVGWGSPECWADEPDASPDAGKKGSKGGCAVVAPGAPSVIGTLLVAFGC